MARQLPYRQLIVWQRAFALALRVLSLAESEPLIRRFYFRDQMCAAAMSIPANIAEGNGRSTPLDYASFVDRARGSLYELDTWLLAARESRLLKPEDLEGLEPELIEIGAMLSALSSSLRRRSTALPSRSPRPSA